MLMRRCTRFFWFWMMMLMRWRYTRFFWFWMMMMRSVFWFFMYSSCSGWLWIWRMRCFCSNNTGSWWGSRINVWRWWRNIDCCYFTLDKSNFTCYIVTPKFCFIVTRYNNQRWWRCWFSCDSCWMMGWWFFIKSDWFICFI